MFKGLRVRAFNPLHPNISIHILHTLLHMLLLVWTKTIHL